LGNTTSRGYNLESEKMDAELESMLDRADELIGNLEDEYKNCLKNKNVTNRAQNITHEVLEKLKHSLDHVMRGAWDKHISPHLSEKDRNRARVYFPIVNDLQHFHSTLSRGAMKDLDKVHKELYDFLLEKQPFSSNDNNWLELLAEIAAEGKHIKLAPQSLIETRRISVSGRGGEVSWDKSSVTFGKGVSILGAPIDPSTQRIVPNPDVIEKEEIWVTFVLDDYGLNALALCKEISEKTRALIEEMDNI
jgi:hypothetical protein